MKTRLKAGSWPERIPQSVLLNGQSLQVLEKFGLDWAAYLLRTAVPTVLKHPDLFILRPVNKMRQINVDSIRALNRDVYRSPHQSDRKVVIVYEADRMHTSAANAFLKTLEEPPEDTTLFLLSVRPYDLLPTLRSRCWWVTITDQNLIPRNNAWMDWLIGFQAWLEGRLTDKSKDVLKAYGLLYRFQGILKQEVQCALTKLPSEEGISEEEQLALKSGMEKNVCQRLFGDIEDAVRNLLVQENKRKFAYLLAEWTSFLEKCYGWTQVNLSEDSALEAFFVHLMNLSHNAAS